MAAVSKHDNKKLIQILGRARTLPRASGSAYLLLKLFDLTGRQEYLDEAEVFASMLAAWPDGCSPVSSYSLFEGISGALCLFADLKAAGLLPSFGLPNNTIDLQ